MKNWLKGMYYGAIFGFVASIIGFLIVGKSINPGMNAYIFLAIIVIADTIFYAIIGAVIGGIIHLIKSSRKRK